MFLTFVNILSSQLNGSPFAEEYPWYRINYKYDLTQEQQQTLQQI